MITKEHPILFSGPMIRALLSGTKTQTRRVVKPQPDRYIVSFEKLGNDWKPVWGVACMPTEEANRCIRCPCGVPGDKLWVREAWRPLGRIRGGNWEGCLEYRADHTSVPLDSRTFWPASMFWTPEKATHWRPSIHMPRWASRITLEVTDVRVERVQEITGEDARAEGVDAIPAAPAAFTHRTSFAKLWNSINAKRGYGWDLNPWVSVVEFRKVST